MIYSKSSTLLILRIILITALIVLSIVSIYETDYIVTPFMFGLLAVVAISELIWHVHTLQRSWARFLLAIEHEDFNRNYLINPKYKELFNAYSVITNKLEKLDTNKHADYQLLQTVTKHIQIGIICYQPNGDVVFTNKTLLEMLEIDAIVNINSLKKNHQKILDYLLPDQTVSGIIAETPNASKLLIKTEGFSLQNKSLKLASFYDIKSTLEKNELESYQKLMQVMTHEIMNSTTPVLSLIEVVNKKLVHENGLNELSEKDQKNVAISLKAIESQTSGMLLFVTAYRKINKPLNPVLVATNIHQLLTAINTLVGNEQTVTLSNQTSEDLSLSIDSGLISQVVINLLKNAQEAIKSVENPEISLSARIEESYLKIEVTDNGAGVKPENISQIFIPFFTTKINGSGIGLAISRKIINAHKGKLVYNRISSKYTQFQIYLPLE